MEAEGSGSRVSNTRWRPEPRDLSDGLDKPSGVCSFFLQIFTIVVTGYERKTAHSILLPYAGPFQKWIYFKESSRCTDGARWGRWQKPEIPPLTLPPWWGLNYPGKFGKEWVPVHTVTDLIHLHQAKRGGIYCTWQYHAQALLMRGLKMANIDESCQ